jgi:hypothetical protein
VNTSAAWLAAELRARAVHRHRPRPRRRLRGDRGEGVISAAIAVLIMAFLGAAMWIGFRTLWTQTETKIECQVNQIGGGGGGAAPGGAAPQAGC